MNADITFHYPPELMNLLIDTIPILNKGKRDVFLFFKGAGVSETLMAGPRGQWQADRDSIGKHDIVRQILTKLNEKGEAYLRERREVLKRVVEFDNFTACWDGDRLKAKGLVVEIRDLLNVKDSFTRMHQHWEEERKQSIARTQAEREAIQEQRQQLTTIKDDLSAQFCETNPHRRGKALEGILNRLFKACGIAVREAFTLRGNQGEGVIEQIDGVIALDGHPYLVEMKWWDQPVGKAEIAPHLVRVYSRVDGRAIIISASDFTMPAILDCKDALHQKVVVLCTLQELVMLLEREADLQQMLRTKVNAAIVDKNPFHRWTIAAT